MAGEKGLDCQIGNPREGAQCTSASENADGTTQEPAGSGRGLCQALRPVTVQLAGEKDGSVSISRNPEPSKEKGGGSSGSASPIKVKVVSPGQPLPIEKKGENVGKQRDNGEKGVKVQKKGEGSDQPISGNTKGAGIPKGGNPGIPKGDNPGTFKVCQLKSASQYSLNIQIGDRFVSAVVDSAAEVSIISDKVYRSLKKPPKKLQEITLHTAG